MNYQRKTRFAAHVRMDQTQNPALDQLLEVLRSLVDIYYLRVSTKKKQVIVAFEDLLEIGNPSSSAIKARLEDEWWNTEVTVHYQKRGKACRYVIQVDDFDEVSKIPLTRQWSRRPTEPEAKLDSQGLPLPKKNATAEEKLEYLEALKKLREAQGAPQPSAEMVKLREAHAKKYGL